VTVPVHALDPLQDPRWPEFLERQSGASVFHSRGWLAALQRTYGYQPIAYTTSPPGAQLTNGLVFCRIASWLTGHRLVSLPFSDHTEPLADREDDFHDLLAFLARDSRRQTWKYIEVRPVTRTPAPSTGFEPSAMFYLHRLDLRAPLENVFQRFHKTCIQRKIRRAEHDTLTYEAGRSEALLQTFYRLLVLTCRRRQLPPQPLDWFRHLVRSFGDSLTIHVASKEDRAAAAILTIRFKRSLVYKYGCSDAGLNRHGGMHLLLWNAIQEATRNGLQELDLGRSDVDTPGLVAFKDRWGATRSVITYARRSASANPSLTTPRALRMARKLFARMPDNFLVAAGQMLYRHVG
jgi:hypothetical protein